MNLWQYSNPVIAIKLAHAVTGRTHAFFVNHIAVVYEGKGQNTALIVMSNGDEYEVEATMQYVLDLVAGNPQP